MAIVTRAGKGSTLTAAEMDQNLILLSNGAISYQTVPLENILNENMVGKLIQYDGEQPTIVYLPTSKFPVGTILRFEQTSDGYLFFKSPVGINCTTSKRSAGKGSLIEAIFESDFKWTIRGNLVGYADVEEVFLDDGTRACIDISDFSRMFQDVNLTTPVTQLNDPVAAIIATKNLGTGVLPSYVGDVITDGVTLASMEPSITTSTSDFVIGNYYSIEIVSEPGAAFTLPNGVTGVIDSTGLYKSFFKATTTTLTFTFSDGDENTAVISCKHIEEPIFLQSNDTKRPRIHYIGGNYCLKGDSVDDGFTAQMTFKAEFSEIHVSAFSDASKYPGYDEGILCELERSGQLMTVSPSVRESSLGFSFYGSFTYSALLSSRTDFFTVLDDKLDMPIGFNNYMARTGFGATRLLENFHEQSLSTGYIAQKDSQSDAIRGPITVHLMKNDSSSYKSARANIFSLVLRDKKSTEEEIVAIQQWAEDKLPLAELVASPVGHFLPDQKQVQARRDGDIFFISSDDENQVTSLYVSFDACQSFEACVGFPAGALIKPVDKYQGVYYTIVWDSWADKIYSSANGLSWEKHSDMVLMSYGFTEITKRMDISIRQSYTSDWSYDNILIYNDNVVPVQLDLLQYVTIPPEWGEVSFETTSIAVHAYDEQDNCFWAIVTGLDYYSESPYKGQLQPVKITLDVVPTVSQINVPGFIENDPSNMIFLMNRDRRVGEPYYWAVKSSPTVIDIGYNRGATIIYSSFDNITFTEVSKHSANSPIGMQYQPTFWELGDTGVRFSALEYDATACIFTRDFVTFWLAGMPAGFEKRRLFAELSTAKSIYSGRRWNNSATAPLLVEFNIEKLI